MSEKARSHEQAVKDVQKQVRNFFTKKQRARIFHGGSNSTRSQSIDHTKLIDISPLNNILEINTKEGYAIVEPNVSLGQLVDATLEYELIPPVISEFPAITVGGAIQGGAGESSSFKYGCLHETCLEYEIITGEGTRLKASASQNKELFHGIACSYGSIGIITLVKIKLIPATPYTKLEYHHISSYKEAVKLIDNQANESVPPDFIDGIMFKKNSGVIMLGYFADEIGLPKASFHKFTDEWFTIHAQKVTSTSLVHEELIPTRDYLFRFDRGAFWTGHDGAKILHIPFNRLTRLILAPLFKTARMYKVLQATHLGQQFLVQDNLIPKKNVATFMEFIDKNFSIYPLWLCPLRQDKNSFLSPSYSKADLVIDVGVWGALQEEYENFVSHNRLLEDKVKELGGRKVLYAHAYYDKPGFWSIYDSKKYLALRQEYSAEIVFPDIYEKTHVSKRYKPAIAKGIWKLLTSN